MSLFSDCTSGNGHIRAARADRVAAPEPPEAWYRLMNAADRADHLAENGAAVDLGARVMRLVAAAMVVFYAVPAFAASDSGGLLDVARAGGIAVVAHLVQRYAHASRHALGWDADMLREEAEELWGK